MHEIGIELLKQQADSIGIPLTILEFDLTAPSDEYKKSMEMHIEKLKEKQLNIALFGDLYLENLRNQRIDNCRRQVFKPSSHCGIVSRENCCRNLYHWASKAS